MPVLPFWTFIVALPLPLRARILTVPVMVLKSRVPVPRLLAPPMVMVVAFSTFVPLPSLMLWTAAEVGLSDVMVVAMMVLAVAKIRLEPLALKPPPLRLVGSPMRKVPVPRFAMKVPRPLMSRVAALLIESATLFPSWKFELVGEPTSPILNEPEAPVMLSFVVELAAGLYPMVTALPTLKISPAPMVMTLAVMLLVWTSMAPPK